MTSITLRKDFIRVDDNSNLGLDGIMGIFSGDKIPVGIISAAA